MCSHHLEHIWSRPLMWTTVDYTMKMILQLISDQTWPPSVITSRSKIYFFNDQRKTQNSRTIKVADLYRLRFMRLRLNQVCNKCIVECYDNPNLLVQSKPIFQMHLFSGCATLNIVNSWIFTCKIDQGIYASLTTFATRNNISL